jgi:hypothetical protein
VNESELEAILKRRGDPLRVAETYLPQQHLVSPRVIWITDVRSGRFYTEIDMLTIKTHTDGRTASLILTGDLTFDSVSRLEQSWGRICPSESVEIDLCQVGTIDVAGKALLARMFSEGVGLVVGTHA